MLRTLVSFCDGFTKLFAAATIVAAVVAAINPWFARQAKAYFASYFGAHYVAKYEVGKHPDGYTDLTKTGQFFLLRRGERGYSKLREGELLQVASTVNARESNGCETTENCGSVATVFHLTKGQCVIVLELLYADSGRDDPESDEEPITDKDGGWVRVATSACGLFG